MTCNGANVLDGLLIGLYSAVAVAAALAGETFVVARLLMRGRVSRGWLIALAVALAGGVLCVWHIAAIWTLRAGVAAGTAGGKGVCMVFWGQQQALTLCAVTAVVLAAVIGARMRWGLDGEPARV